MRNKIFLSVTLALVIALLGTYIYMTPADINKSYTGVIYSDNKDTTKNIDIDFKGTLRKRPFTSNIVVSQVSFDGLNYEVELTQNSSNEYVGFISTSAEEKYNILGSVILSEDLEEIWISSDDINTKYKDIYYVVSPTDNKIEARKNSLNYLSQNK